MAQVMRKVLFMGTLLSGKNLIAIWTSLMLGRTFLMAYGKNLMAYGTFLMETSVNFLFFNELEALQTLIETKEKHTKQMRLFLVLVSF